MRMDSSRPWNEFTIVAFDLEASGPYPLDGEICEIGAVKWKAGQVVDEFQTLIKTEAKMSDFIVSIHGITNEMIADAPKIGEKASEFRDFIGEATTIAHHAPFDMGFIANVFENYSLPLPLSPGLCSSLLSRKLISDVENHKLQTLIRHLNLAAGTAHRALDDAKACLGIALECFTRVGPSAPMSDVLKAQETSLNWIDFSLLELKKTLVGVAILEAISSKRDLDIVYDGGSRKGEIRRLKPIGVVRNPTGDFLVGICFNDKTQKRFYLNRVKEAGVV